MLFFSHWLDLVGKLVSIAIFFVILTKTRVMEIARPVMEKTPNPEFFTMMFMGVLLVGFYFAIHRSVVDVAVTSLYVRLRFGVSASWQEARLLRRLFCIQWRTMRWSPMAHVRALPVEQRLPALVEAAAHE